MEALKKRLEAKHSEGPTGNSEATKTDGNDVGKDEASLDQVNMTSMEKEPGRDRGTKQVG